MVLIDIKIILLNLVIKMRKLNKFYQLFTSGWQYVHMCQQCLIINTHVTVLLNSSLLRMRRKNSTAKSGLVQFDGRLVRKMVSSISHKCCYWFVNYQLFAFNLYKCTYGYYSEVPGQSTLFFKYFTMYKSIEMIQKIIYFFT